MWALRDEGKNTLNLSARSRALPRKPRDKKKEARNQLRLIAEQRWCMMVM